jgi:hypothetical protein
MRKLIVSTYLTLDGVVTLDGDMAQRWHFPFFTDELAKYAHQQLFARCCWAAAPTTASPPAGRRSPTRKAMPTA